MAELTELENEGVTVTWAHFKEKIISYLGTQLPAGEARVKFKACKKTSTVAKHARK